MRQRSRESSELGYGRIRNAVPTFRYPCCRLLLPPGLASGLASDHLVALHDKNVLLGLLSAVGRGARHGISTEILQLLPTSNVNYQFPPCSVFLGGSRMTMLEAAWNSLDIISPLW